MKNNIVISVIMPTFNAEDFILSSILSVINQTFTQWELIVVDDCSIDQSVKVVRALAERDSRVKIIQLSENTGAAVARNRAIQESQGRYIAFLDSDDLWMPEKLEKQLTFMRETGCPFSFSAYDKINGAGDVIGHVGVPKKVSYNRLLKTCVIGCLTSVYDTDYFGKVEMPLIRKRQDFALWLKLLKQIDYAYGIQDTLGQYRVRLDSISANKFNTAQYTWRMYRDIEKLSLVVASYYFFHYSVRGLLRTKAPWLSKMLGLLD